MQPRRLFRRAPSALRQLRSRLRKRRLRKRQSLRQRLRLQKRQRLKLRKRQLQKRRLRQKPKRRRPLPSQNLSPSLLQNRSLNLSLSFRRKSARCLRSSRRKRLSARSLKLRAKRQKPAPRLQRPAVGPIRTGADLVVLAVRVARLQAEPPLAAALVAETLARQTRQICLILQLRHRAVGMMIAARPGIRTKNAVRSSQSAAASVAGAAPASLRSRRWSMAKCNRNAPVALRLSGVFARKKSNGDVKAVAVRRHSSCAKCGCLKLS